MKKQIIFAVAALVFLSSMAQEPAKYRITYDCEAESFVGKKETYRWTLDRGNESAVFYCRDYRNYNVELEVFLNSVDNMFVSRIKERFPLLTDKDVQLFMLLRLQIPANRIASIYCISEKAVKQKLYLYKEKVGLEGEKRL